MKNTSVWFPCTQMKDLEQHPPLHIARGEGIYLYDDNGKSYIDAVSSWWVNLFGHGNKRIGEAIAEQFNTLDHVIFAGVSHDPALSLADSLVAITPDELKHVFFADNGSAAVEAAMKMSYGYRQNTGQPEKNKFLFLKYGYNGETLGALSVCGDDYFTALYGPVMPENIMVQGPDCFRCPYGKTRDACDAQCFEHMEKALETLGEKTTAVMIEPLVQLAGGFKMYPPVYLRKLREATLRHDVHLLVDEIAVGFGRTGTLFAMEQAGVSGDLLCLSKGITGGTLPLSVVLATDEIYDSFYADFTELKAFLHSHSYTANPLACAAANATLKIFEEDDVIETNKAKAAYLARALKERFEDHPNVGEVRTTGFITAVELVKDRETKTSFDWKERTGFRIYREAVKRGALLRNLGDIIYCMPPYVITQEEIDTLADIALASTREILGS